jgi:hypothetical protein
MAVAYYFAAHFNQRALSTPSSPLKLLPQVSTTTTPSTQPTTTTTPALSTAQTHTLIPTSSQSSSPFFRFPAELRNQIYEALLCPDTPQARNLPTYYSSSKTPSIHPAILLSCKRAQQEATDLLYTTHVFHAHPSLLTAMPFLLSPGKPLLNGERVGKIRRWQLTMRLDTDPRFSAKQAKEAFSGAEYLEIRVWQSMFDGADCSVLKLFVGVRGVRVARVTGSVEAELARWLEGRMISPLEEECCEDRGRVMGEEWFGGEREAWAFGNR